MLLASSLALVMAPATAEAQGRGKGKAKSEKHEQLNADQMRFRGMDRNNDGRITRAEWRGNDQSFRNHDWNGDGVLSGNEVIPGAERDDVEESRRGRFDELDRNNDERIGHDEWPGRRATFDQLDINHDGRLTREELRHETEDAWVRRFEDLDRNNSGRIELNEWRDTRASFERLDVNNDGVLTRGELGGWRDETSARRFDELDRNNNGRIELNEWRDTRTSFERLDADHNGVISREEFRPWTWSRR